MKIDQDKPLNEIRMEILDWAKSIGAVFNESAEIGFMRPCIAIQIGGSSLSYNPALSDNDYTPLRDLWDTLIDPPADVEDAYHKGDYMAVLIHDDDSEKATRQMHLWIQNIEHNGGAKLVEFATGATGIQAIMSGLSETCIISLSRWKELKGRINELHPAIIRDSFEDKNI